MDQYAPAPPPEYDESTPDYSPSIGYSPPSQDATLVIQTNPKKIIEELVHILKREIFDEDKQIWVRIMINGKPMKPIINDLGMSTFIADAMGVINQNTILSNLTEEEVSRNTLDLVDTLIAKMLMRVNEFEIDEADMETIVMTISRMAYIALKRGYKEGERRFLKTSVRSTEQIIQRPQDQNGRPMVPQKKGLFSGLFKNNK